MEEEDDDELEDREYRLTLPLEGGCVVRVCTSDSGSRNMVTYGEASS